MKSRYNILFFLLLTPALLFANGGKLKGKYSKERKISKEFNVNTDAELKVDNAYGNINITTWNESRTVIDVLIKTSSDNESKAIEKLEDITIDFKASSSLVIATTNFEGNGRNSSWKRNNNHVSYEIIYTIKLPMENSVDLTNKYGAITITTINGKARINAMYGDVILGDLNADNNNIKMRYTDHATINYMKSGKIDADYSDFSLEKTENLELIADYTKSNIGNVNELNYHNRYGKLRVDNAANVNGKADYNGGFFKNVQNNFNVTARYSTLNLEKTQASMKNIIIEGSYSKITLGLHPKYNFKFNASLGYGGLKGANFITMTTKNEKGSKKDYEGFFGNENTNNNININSRYGSITLTQN
ncbi:hypothetical protein ULMS_20460 [Patiriisocius marinistellae]|uniref:Adhesin domain-containing protein n=1 Tax=Patiriisocius marinistellae TaxID=2494560 RepID=A0A5J4FYS4_9FLAO|nr:hypothetical protein [Patiriisocius marinistellae]GEQ86538.1 hypothetical protein ULMS_20460 [Patiriisocius marinistellae]